MDSVIAPVLVKQVIQSCKLPTQVRADKSLEVHPLALDMSQLSTVLYPEEGEIPEGGIELVDILKRARVASWPRSHCIQIRL